MAAKLLKELNGQLCERQRDLLAQPKGSEKHNQTRDDVARLEKVVADAHRAHRAERAEEKRIKDAELAAQKEQELLREIANEELKEAAKAEKRMARKRAKREAKRRQDKERKRAERETAKKHALKASLDELYLLQKKMLSVPRSSQQWQKFRVRVQDTEDRIAELSVAGDFSGSSVYSPSEGSAVMVVAAEDDSFVLKHLNDELYMTQQEMLTSPKASKQKQGLKQKIAELDERIMLYRKLKTDEALGGAEELRAAGIHNRINTEDGARNPRWSIELSEEAVAEIGNGNQDTRLQADPYRKRDSFEIPETDSLHSGISGSDPFGPHSWSMSEELVEPRRHRRTLSLGSMPGSFEEQLQERPNMVIDFAAAVHREEAAQKHSKIEECCAIHLQEKKWLLSEVEGYRARCELLSMQLESAQEHIDSAAEMACSAWNWRWGNPGPTPLAESSTCIDIQLLRWCEEVMMMQELSRITGQAVIDHLSAQIDELWTEWGVPSHTVSVYGSRRSGLALPSSDFDISISCFGENLGLRCSLAMLAAKLGGDPGVQDVVAVLGEHVRVPVIKLTLAPSTFGLDFRSQIRIDITISDHTQTSQSAHETTLAATQQLLSETPLLRPLVLLSKQLLAHYRLNDAYNGGLSSYVWFLMVAAFLQSLPAQERTSLSKLFQKLLAYYGTVFDAENSCVCPVLAGSRPVQQQQLPQNGTAPQFLRVVDPSTGILLGGSTFQFAKIQAMFDDTSQMIISSSSALSANEGFWQVLDLGFNDKILPARLFRRNNGTADFEGSPDENDGRSSADLSCHFELEDEGRSVLQ